MRRMLVGLAVLALCLAGVSTPVHGQDIAAMTFEQLTIADTALGLDQATVQTGGKVAMRCIGVLETAAVRIRVDGTSPTASIGQLVAVGSLVDLRGVDNIRKFKAIRTGGTSGVLPMTCFPAPAEQSASAYVSVTPTPAVTSSTLLQDGTAALPALAFASDTDTGLYRIGANNLGVALGGAIEANWTATAFSPGASNGSALGTTALMWADLFLASGAVVNFDNGDVTVTHAADTLSFAGATTYPFDAPVYLAAGSAAAPALTFTTDPDSGWYSIGANNVGFALNGAIEANWTTTAFSPGASDGSALGTTALMWSDLFLASEGVINFNNGNALITHAAGQLTVTGNVLANNAAGPALLDEAATTTNPTLIPDKAETDTGIGWASDTLHVVLGGANAYAMAGASMSPGVSNAAALGTTSLMWADLFLAEGGVINFNNGDITATHSTNNLAFAGGTFSFDGAVTLTSGVAGGCTGTPTVATAGVATTCTGPEYSPIALMARIQQLEALVAQLLGKQ